ncbi:MAG: chemotaxis protein CheX [Deltaproteobacteria bacterium]|nr:chemotaxis protein CheX [Deltaproteobacteria bacterium]
MEKEVLLSAMKRSISEVLEKMFFLPVDFPARGSKEDLPGSGSGKILATRLGFSGPFSGHFVFFSPEGLTASLAASFLGEDPGKVTAAHVSDTMKEIVNMIAGNTFSILDDQAIFDLAIPEILEPFAGGKGSPGSEEGIFILVQTIDNCLGLELVVKE